jgi:hypothetical protein
LNRDDEEYIDNVMSVTKELLKNEYLLEMNRGMESRVLQLESAMDYVKNIVELITGKKGMELTEDEHHLNVTKLGDQLFNIMVECLLMHVFVFPRGDEEENGVTKGEDEEEEENALPDDEGSHPHGASEENEERQPPRAEIPSFEMPEVRGSV